MARPACRSSMISCKACQFGEGKPLRPRALSIQQPFGFLEATRGKG